MNNYIDKEVIIKKIESCIVPTNDSWDIGYNTAMSEILEFIKNMPCQEQPCMTFTQYFE